MAPTTIPAGTGAHTTLQSGQSIKIINPSGHQVIDCWAFPLAADTRSRWMSMAQSRSALGKVIPSVGDTLIDTHRQPVVTLTSDTSPGIHDMLFPACDSWRYIQAGKADHASCATNLQLALQAHITAASGEELGEQALKALEENITTWAWTPEPLNLFMNVPVQGARLNVDPPSCKKGDCVVLRAEIDLLIVLSACPNDLMDTNGGLPGHAAYEVLG